MLVRHIVTKANNDLLSFVCYFTTNAFIKPTSIFKVVVFTNLLPIFFSKDESDRKWEWIQSDLCSHLASFEVRAEANDAGEFH